MRTLFAAGWRRGDLFSLTVAADRNPTQHWVARMGNIREDIIESMPNLTPNEVVELICSYNDITWHAVQFLSKDQQTEVVNMRSQLAALAKDRK
jgi:hypothetical protein